ncbi:uncharacterized protein LODBEIA_P09350 [Lodderomyces beijingensis]|uniref:LAA1-like C-terminal TPR repeats domain-containing protein n=1 Tax=Lodderomyces beijingensis TaxID=1775926 RepID=A0ABP0ZHX4_9ASCO
MDGFDQIVKRMDSAELLTFLVEMSRNLARKEVVQDSDFHVYLSQLIQLVERQRKLEPRPVVKKKKGEAAAPAETPAVASYNVFKLLSKNLVTVLRHLPSKIYDITNELLNYLQLDEQGKLTQSSKIAIVILIDLFDNFPSKVGSLITFSVSQIYKILKKDPTVDGYLIYLLYVVSKHATKQDIDEKLNTKLAKIATKSLTQDRVSFDIDNQKANSTVLIKKNYVLFLKNSLILAVSSHYESLLAASSKSGSSSSKLKPETVMSQQYQFQQALLSSNEAVFDYGFGNRDREIRIAMVDLVTNLLLNFIPVGDFQPFDYLIRGYPLPESNFYDKKKLSNMVSADGGEIIVDNRSENNTIWAHDSELALNRSLELKLFQSSVISTIVFYLQMEQFQNPDYLQSHFTDLLNLILLKFSDMSSSSSSSSSSNAPDSQGNLLLQIHSQSHSHAHVHVQNTDWIKTVEHFKFLVEYILEEVGTSGNDMLSSFLISKFSTDKDAGGDVTIDMLDSKSLAKSRKRDSNIFGIKASKNPRRKEQASFNINIYNNPYQAYLVLLMTRILIPTGLAFESSEKHISTDDDVYKSSGSTTQDEFATANAATSGPSLLQDSLFALIVNDNAYTRNYALETLLKYAEYDQANINQLILTTFRLVEQAQKQLNKETDQDSANKEQTKNICGIPAVRLVSYSLALSAILKQTDPTLLQNAVIVKILTFCTQTLKHNNNPNEASSCWIILTSLVSIYKFSEYVRLNSSQLLVFWKSLLTSQFISNSTTTDQKSSTHINDVIGNLKVRTFALTCLFNYVMTVDLTPESLKQMQFLLTKSYNYLSHLESNIEAVGAVTTLDGSNFNDSSFDPDVIGNILYSNYSSNKQLPAESILISLIFNCKKVILQGFTQLAVLLKSEINSNVVIFLIKMFSDHRLFARNSSIGQERLVKSKAKTSPKVLEEIGDELLYLDEDYNHAFGVTSLLSYDRGACIEEKSLLLKFGGTHAHDNDKVSSAKGSRSIAKTRAAERGKKLRLDSNPAHYWFDGFDKTAYASRASSINNDPNGFHTQSSSSSSSSPYSTSMSQGSPALMTSLVDSSIQLFFLSFPFLTTKIQFSLLEQIRNSLTAHPIDALRLKAIQINVSVALHGVAQNAVENSTTFDKDIVSTICEIIKKIEVENRQLIMLNSSTIGLCALLMSKDQIHGEITNLVNDIVTRDDPYRRGFLILALSEIYYHTKVGFGETFNVLSQLINDPNPVLYYYTLKSFIVIFDTNADKLSLIPEVLSKIFGNFVDNSFNDDLNSKVLVNLRTRYGAVGGIAQLLKLFVTSLGPSLREWNQRSKLQLRDLIICLSHGIGSVTLFDYAQVYKQLMNIFKELIIFDPNLIEEEVELFTDLLRLIISKNLKISVTSVSPTSLNSDSIFPFNASYDLYSAAYECFYELLKIYGAKIISSETEFLLWVSMNIMPCPELERLIMHWIEIDQDKNWFNTLNALFKSSMKKVVGPFLESNYQEKLLPLSQRQKKQNVNSGVDLKDDENEVIVGDDDAVAEKNEPISWKFKQFIFEALNHLLSLAYQNPELVEKLKNRIPDIVKLSFLGITSSVTESKLRGLDLLNSALELFGDLEDPLYPSGSILEQQQAQIISALVPCFTPGNDYTIIVHAVKVSSNFMNLPRIKYYSKKRILKTLIELLEELSSNKFVKFDFLENMSEFGKKSIQLASLNCWAVLKIQSYQDIDGTEEKEFREVLAKYSSLLTSLWIQALREFSTIKYSESTSKELDIYADYWINLVSVLSAESEANSSMIDDALAGDTQNFFFIMFSQCVESLIKGKNVAQILKCVQKLMRNESLVELVFDDQLFGEVIVVFDRLMLVDDNTEVQCLLLDTLEATFETFVCSHQSNIEVGFDKLFEIVRVTMLPLFRILPFIKSNFDSNDASHTILMKHAESASNLIVLKKCFEILTKIIALLPDFVKPDLYSCLLYIFAKIYESKKIFLISVIIPHLKQVIADSKKLGPEPTAVFHSIVTNYYEVDASLTYTVITSVILVTTGGLELDEADSTKLSDALITLLDKPETASLAIKCIKSLVQQNDRASSFVVKKLITHLVNIASGMQKEGQEDKEEKEGGANTDPKIIIEILMLFAKTIAGDSDKQEALYSILLPVLVQNDAGLDKTYLHDKLMYLVRLDTKVFKEIVNKSLSSEQKSLIESSIKMNNRSSSHDIDQLPQIELKSFD